MKPIKSKPTETISSSPPEGINKLSQTEGYVEVTQTLIGKLQSEAKQIKIRPFVTDPARVEIHAKRHIPLGKEIGNLTVAVTINVPCYKEEIISVFRRVDEVVDKLMAAKVEKIVGDLHGGA